MIKCEVLVERISLTVNKGSVVVVDDRQFEIAKKHLKPIHEVVKETKVEDKVDEVETREDKEVLEKEVKAKRTKKK